MEFELFSQKNEEDLLKAAAFCVQFTKVKTHILEPFRRAHLLAAANPIKMSINPLQRVSTLSAIESVGNAFAHNFPLDCWIFDRFVQINRWHINRHCIKIKCWFVFGVHNHRILKQNVTWQRIGNFVLAEEWQLQTIVDIQTK